jgi:uncharacterized peroxidase-related enzyme
MFLSNPPENDAVRTIFADVESEEGYVMNFVRLWAWRPDVHLAFTRARQLLASTTQLHARDIAILNASTASTIGDAYCSIAWGTKLAHLSDAATAAALLQGSDAPALTERERVLQAWATAMVSDPNSTTREDIETMRAAGLTETEIFDATLFVAFRLAFSTVNDALGARPDQKLARAAPAPVLASVTFGRAVEE